MKTIVYDVEIERAILNGAKAEAFEEDYPGIKYCYSFKDFDKMGVACLCAIEIETNRCFVFCKDNLFSFQPLIDGADRLVSFNGNAFDAPLLHCNGLTIPSHKSFDLLEEWRAATGKRVSLDKLAQANLGEGKTGNGALAPIDWQQGRIGSVITYCISDTWLTAELYKLVQSQRWLMCPKTGTKVQMAGMDRLF